LRGSGTECHGQMGTSPLGGLAQGRQVSSQPPLPPTRQRGSQFLLE
jgi:hypothetical protein